MEDGNRKEVVANEWLDRTAALLKHPDLADSSATKSFLVAFQSALGERVSEKVAIGHRNISSKAIEAGIKAMVASVLGCKPDVPCFNVKQDTHSIRITKSADVSFTLQDHRRLVFEVKTALEFNAVAAAAIEGILFRKLKDSGVEIAAFVLFSLAGKNYDDSRAKEVLKLMTETTSPVGEVFVLSEQAGRLPEGRSDQKILDEVISSLSKFETYLKTFQIPRAI